MLKRRGVLANFAAGAAGWMIVPASAVRAQTWPSQPIKIVVPYIPGGATDTAGRIVAQKMGDMAGQQVIVENKGGGNTIIGMETVAKAKPDGYTLLLGSTTLATNAALGLKQPFDPLKDFQTISSIADIPDMIAVNKDLPIRDYASMVEWMHKQPEQVRFACSGIGNQPHLWGELFKSHNKLKMEVVGYKGSADAIRDVMGGHVPLVVDVVLPSGTHVAQGRMTGICVASAERSAMCPTVPTVVELGMPDLVSAVFYGIAAPAGLPGNLVERLNGLCRDIVKDEGVKKKFAELGFVTTGSTPQAYHDKLVFETARWTKVVRDNNIKVEGS
jgi:tripartite-type tricarboxylate transporter receptor subunit TctC